MFRHEDLLKSSDKGQYPGDLAALWKKKTKKDPRLSAARIVHREKQERREWMLGFISFLLSFLLIVVGVYWEELLWSQFVLAFGIGFFFVGIVFATFLLSSLVERWRTHYTDGEWNFPGYLGQFLDWGGLTLPGIKMRSVKDLRDLAEKILIKTAGEVLAEEGKNLGEHQYKKSIFEEQYLILTELSLVGGGYEHFFDEAHRLIAEKKKTQTETPPETTAAIIG